MWVVGPRGVFVHRGVCRGVRRGVAWCVWQYACMRRHYILGAFRCVSLKSLTPEKRRATSVMVYAYIYICVCVCACVLCVRVRVADPPPPPDVGINRTLQQHASACLKQKSGAAFHWSGLSIALSNITRRLEAKVRHSVPLVGSPILQLGLLDLCVAVPGVLRRVERTKVLWRLPVHFLCVVGGS